MTKLLDPEVELKKWREAAIELYKRQLAAMDRIIAAESEDDNE